MPLLWSICWTSLNWIFLSLSHSCLLSWSMLRPSWMTCQAQFNCHSKSYHELPQQQQQQPIESVIPWTGSYIFLINLLHCQYEYGLEMAVKIDLVWHQSFPMAIPGLLSLMFGPTASLIVYELSGQPVELGRSKLYHRWPQNTLMARQNENVAFKPTKKITLAASP